METDKNQSPILIAVMGVTGAGKSTFVNIASGSALAVGDDLESCTSEVQLSKPFVIDGRTVILVDTPGFDDSSRAEADILRSIAEFLTSTYENGRKLSGVIFLHRISDNRMGGIARKNFRLFRAICGDDALKRVVIATTMWSEISEEVGLRREKELSTKEFMFKPALEMGAELVRHANSVSSAHSVVRKIVGFDPRALSIQTEMVDQHNALVGTTAGRHLKAELDATTQKHRNKEEEIAAEIRALREQDEQQRVLITELRAEVHDVREKLRAYESQSRSLETESGAPRHGDWEKIVVGLIEQTLRERQREHVADSERQEKQRRERLEQERLARQEKERQKQKEAKERQEQIEARKKAREEEEREEQRQKDAKAQSFSICVVQ